MSNTIYMISNSINDKVYIGQTKRYKERLYEHFHYYKKYDQHIYRAMRKYGANEFTMTPICSVPDMNDLDFMEKLFISEHDSFNNGYNMDKGGKLREGYKHHKITKKRISISQRGKNNQRWMGYYHTPFGVLESCRDIIRYTDTISRMSIVNWCKNPDKIITKIYTCRSKYLTEDMLGKTFRDIGFWFEYK